jgi:hypothetical protein
LKTFFPLVFVGWAAFAHAAPIEWLEGTVLADCEYCKTSEFSAERLRVANQLGAEHDPASGMGYVVTLGDDGPVVWGRAALVGTGNLIRTDAHVLYTDQGLLKTRDGKMYFEPMHHGGIGNLIEIDLSAIKRGGAVGPLETDVKNDWAIARLKEDAIAKFNGDRVFAFLWDLQITHDDIVKPDYARASALVLSRDHTFEIRACRAVTDDHPSNYWFGVEEVFFLQCPSEYLLEGSSGSGLAVSAADGTWSLGGQLVAGEMSQRVPAGMKSGPVGQQLFLGNVPMFRRTLAIAYQQELLRRGIDPLSR